MSAWAPGTHRRYKSRKSEKRDLNRGGHTYGFNSLRGRWTSRRRRLSGSLAVGQRRAGPDCHQKQASTHFPRLAVNFLSNRSLCIVPAIESPSTVAEYSIVNVPWECRA